MNLKAERLNRGLTLLAASGEMNVHRHTLDRAEQGQMPSPPMAKRIADFYGVQVTDIWPVNSTTNGQEAA